MLSLKTTGATIKYGRKIFGKTNISNPLKRTRTCAHQGVRNVSFSENFAYALNGWSQNKLRQNLKPSKFLSIVQRNCPPLGENLEIMGRVRKLLKCALAHENFSKTQLKVNKSKKRHFFLENEKSNVRYSDAKLV